jgi:uncharacterized protein YjbJ (UPF0337 family)
VSTFDEMKGRAKEATGDATGNKDLEREGKLDQAEGKVKDAADAARDKAGEGMDKVEGAFNRDH